MSKLPSPDASATPGAEPAPTSLEKQTYSKPTLTNLGSIVELTKGGGSSIRDFVQPRKKK
jgi:hypothetical protein